MELKEKEKASETTLVVASVLCPTIRSGSVSKALDPCQLAGLDMYMACRPEVRGRPKRIGCLVEGASVWLVADRAVRGLL